MSNEYWFARRFPVGHKSNALAPVTKQGRMVGLLFTALMIVGGAIGAAVAAAGDFILGICIFAVLGGIGGAMFIIVAQQKTDREHTVEDYAAGRVGGPKAAAAPSRGPRR
ncbi:MAG: hypothetical protein IT534_00575 [Bauldia sp.]|nr:hypothetical protein [Bauldia sp.]